MTAKVSLSLRNGIFYLDTRSIDGKRLRISTGCADRAHAEAEATRLLRLADPKKSARGERTLRSGFERMWERGEKWSNLRSPMDVKHRQAEIMDILGADTPLDRLTTPVLNLLRASLLSGGDGRRTEATVQRYMHCLTAMLNSAARDWNWIDHVPTYKALAKAKVKEFYFLDSEIQTLVTGETRPQFARLWLFLAETGARLGETLSLEWSDIDLAKGTVNFRAETTKALKSKMLPLSATLLSNLKLSKDEGNHKPFAVNKNTAQAYFKQTVRALGLPDQASIHSLRHTCATKIVSMTGNLKLAQAQLGHATIGTTARYAKVDTRQLETVAGMFSNGDTGGGRVVECT